MFQAFLQYRYIVTPLFIHNVYLIHTMTEDTSLQRSEDRPFQETPIDPKCVCVGVCSQSIIHLSLSMILFKVTDL